LSGRSGRACGGATGRTGTAGRPKARPAGQQPLRAVLFLWQICAKKRKRIGPDAKPGGATRHSRSVAFWKAASKAFGNNGPHVSSGFAHCHQASSRPDPKRPKQAHGQPAWFYSKYPFQFLLSSDYFTADRQATAGVFLGYDDDISTRLRLLFSYNSTCTCNTNLSAAAS
jgi:hypothetical protein